MAGGAMAGSMFGRYELRRLLGVGGMGEVYEAFDTSKRRVVAVKVLDRHLATDPTYVERFRRESFALASVQEPHVIPVHDWGEIDGVLYIDMRLVRGTDLKERLQRHGRLSPAESVQVVEQIAAALDAAHDQGLIHRDVKPANILLTANLFAYLVDFGIAHAESDPQLTSAGSAVGSMAYMAPERFDAVPMTAAVDTYALACVFYECLVGRVPFPVNSLPGAIGSHQMAPPPRPSTVDPDLAVYDAVIERGMAKRPGDRYATSGDLARAARAAMVQADRDAPSTVSGPAVVPPPAPEPPAPAPADPPETAPSPEVDGIGIRASPGRAGPPRASGPVPVPPRASGPHPVQGAGGPVPRQPGGPSGPVPRTSGPHAVSGPVGARRVSGPQPASGTGRGTYPLPPSPNSGEAPVPRGPVSDRDPVPGAAAAAYQGGGEAWRHAVTARPHPTVQDRDPAWAARNHLSAPLPSPARSGGASAPLLAGVLGALIVIALAGIAIVVLLTMSRGDDRAQTGVPGTGTQEVPAPTVTEVTGPSTGRSTAPSAAPESPESPFQGSVASTDRQGFLADGPRCNADDPAVTIARTPNSAIVICRTGDHRYYYKGANRNGTVEIDDPVPAGGGGFTATRVAPDGTFRYQVSSAGLTILQNGSVIGSEAMAEFAFR
ncbi:protein kinase [Nocardia thailandica]|uniref:non-specific serine/threonine protein kinase n=1 Tax=Nocardia thailandica TaxID=257275 RepID=A0ABW6PLW5_9NOCA